MDLKQVSETYCLPFHRGGLADYTDRENQNETAVKPYPDSPHTKETSAFDERSDLNPDQAMSLTGEVASLIVEAGPFMLERLYNTLELKMINPRYV